MIKLKDAKVGMKVKIKENLTIPDLICPIGGYDVGLNGRMKKLEGKVRKIESIKKYEIGTKSVYVIKLENCEFSWTLNSIEALEEKLYEAYDFNDILDILFTDGAKYIDIFSEKLGSKFTIEKLIFNDKATVVFYKYQGKVKKVTAVFDGEGNFDKVTGFEVCINKIMQRVSRDFLKRV